ncbi:tape measure protein [Empedobacter brevis]|uniref:tape measure protein n=1 Tax=Empedobacter brevis TaxID=247 RepID=UPI0039AF63C3
MASKSKIELLLELGDKLFNSRLNKVQDKLNSTLNKMEGRLGRFKARAEKALNSFGSKSESSFSFGIGAGLGMKVFDVVTSAISNLTSEAVNSADSLEKFKSTMNFAGFDSGQIQKAQTEVKKYADDTVYDLNTIANTSAQLAANGVKDYIDLTKAAGNLNAVAGGSADTYKSVALVLTQVNGAGKLITQDWNQMANAIPGASGKMQEALRKNGAFTGNFRDAMEDGKISADEFNKAIMDLGFQQAAIDAAKSTSTFEGAIGQLEAEIVNGLMAVIDAIGMDNITGAINTLTSFVGTLTGVFVWFFNEINNGNPVMQILATIIGALALGLGTYLGVINAVIIVTKLWTLYQTALNANFYANPIGLIIGAIVVLIALVYTAIQKYDEWGAALLQFLGPIGWVINAFKSIYDHWESIKKAFQTDGISGALRRIGIVLMDVVLKPLKQILELISEYDPTGISKGLLNKVNDVRSRLDLETDGEKDAKRKLEWENSSERKGYLDAMTAHNNSIKPKKVQSLYAGGTSDDDKKKGKGGKKKGEHLNSITGASNQVRNITIQIDSFNKGGINIARSETVGMTKDDVEAWFMEMMRRTLINAENG